MAHFKRKKSKRSVRCTLCTSWRWMGNGKDRKPAELSSHRDLQKVRRAILSEATES